MWTDRHKEANSRFSQFWEKSKKIIRSHILTLCNNLFFSFFDVIWNPIFVIWHTAYYRPTQNFPMNNPTKIVIFFTLRSVWFMRDFTTKSAREIISVSKLPVDSMVIKMVIKMIPVEQNAPRSICLCKISHRPLNHRSIFLCVIVWGKHRDRTSVPWHFAAVNIS